MAGLLVIGGALIPAQAFAATRAAAAPTAQSCPSVEFFGARGSGQPYDSGGPFRGLGPEVHKMISVVQARLHAKGLRYGTDAIPYPADSVNDLKPSAVELALIANPLTTDAGLALYYEDNVKKYLNSIATGVSDTIFDINSWHGTCPSTVFVLAGYSQGAMVMHQAEVSMHAKHDSAFGKIAGTLLLGDGNRVPNTKAKEFGTSANNAEGIATYLTPLSSHPDVALPKTTANICNKNDLVCNFGISQVLHFSASAKVHTSYATNCTKSGHCDYQPVLTTAANWVGNAVITRLLG